MARSGSYATEFRERAAELRAIAELVHDKQNRDILLKCADDYEKTAAQYEKAVAQGGKFTYPPTQFLPGFTALTPTAEPAQDRPKTTRRRGPASSD
jgi:hypothetical protein